MGIPLPYGGLTGQNLDDYIKKDGGPQATIGFNPNANVPKNNEDDDEDDESPTTKSASPAEVLNRYKDLQKNPTKNPAPIKDVISKLLNNNNDLTADAMQHRDNLQLLAMLSKAGSTAGAAFTPLANTRPDDSMYNSLMQQSNQPLNDVKAKAASDMENLKQAQLVNQLKTEMQKSDPNSPISEQYRKFAKIDNDNLSAADLEKLEPQINRQFIAHENLLNRLAMLQDRQNAKSGDLEYKRIQDAQNTLNTKDKAYVTAKSGLDAAEEAEQVLNASLQNPISAQSVPIVMARLATHGQRINQAEINKLTGGQSIEDYSKRLAQKLATGTLSNNDYDNFKQLVNIYKKDAADTMTKHELEAAKRLSVLNNKDKNENYRLLTGKDYVESHPQDDEAVTWAKNNPNDPRAAAILKANGL